MEHPVITLPKLSMIWFGAALSIAEIMTGTYFAPLGLERGLCAIVLGHVIGCILLYLAGLIGAYERKSSMETVSLAFGQKGMYIFAILNILQLVGWTSIMIYDGALMAVELWSLPFIVWTITIGLFIILWIYIGLLDIGKIHSITTLFLGLLSIYLMYQLLEHTVLISNTPSSVELSFIEALELSIAMPISWLPLISDYTRFSSSPKKASAISATTYGLVSIGMYALGLMAALYTGESNLAHVLISSGLGISGLILIIFSTVTTTFMDAYSAGISSESIQSVLPGKTVAIFVTLLGTIGASLYAMDSIISFLYVIGSVFTPMIVILLLHFYYIQKKYGEPISSSIYLLSWLLGCGGYHYFLSQSLYTGATMTTIVWTLCITYILVKLALWKSSSK